MKNCGKRFHSEVGKFRFLNELIKVVSPKVRSLCSLTTTSSQTLHKRLSAEVDTRTTNITHQLNIRRVTEDLEFLSELH